MSCEGCEYRACRREDGSLGDCKEPELSVEIMKKDYENILLSLVIVIFFLFSLLYLILE